MWKFDKSELLAEFASIEDPRIDRKKLYPASEMLFLTLVGALCGVESWRGIVDLGENLLDTLRDYFPYENGIPSFQTLGRFFSIIEPKSFENILENWTKKIAGDLSGKHIAIDGKSVRGSAVLGNTPIHLLSAYLVNHGISLAQTNVGKKENELVVLPELLGKLDIAGASVSLDAMSTQKSTAKLILEKKADYLLALKANHKNLFENSKIIFESPIEKKSEYIETEKSHGRINERTYSLVSVNKDNLPALEQWPGLKALGRVQNRTIRNQKESVEERYYLLSFGDVKKFGELARNHWAIESFHWVLDVVYDEDGIRKRKDHAPRNFAIIRKLALNILRNFKGEKSFKAIQMRLMSNKIFFKDVMGAIGK